LDICFIEDISLRRKRYLRQESKKDEAGKQQKDGKARVTALPHSKPPEERAHAS
jgi:hypothetical protein